MKPSVFTAAAFALLLPGCNNSPEQVPDIEDAIPVDEAEAASEGETESDADAALAGSDNPEDAQADAPQAAPASNPSTSSATMESGSNETGGRAPDPSRTKLIPAD